MGLDHHVLLPWMGELGEGVRAVLFDFSGHGASRRGLPPEAMGHDVWVQDIEDLRTHLGLERFVLFGHSYGGLLAQEYAQRYPERLAALILCNTAPVVDFGEVIVANAHRRGTAEQAATVVRALTEPVQTDSEMERLFRTILPLYFHEWDADVGRRLLDGVRYRAAAFMVGNTRGMPSFDVRPWLPDLRVPTFMISGDDDWIMPEEHGGRRLASLIPGSRHEVLTDCGHFSYAERPDAFRDVVRSFLREVAA